MERSGEIHGTQVEAIQTYGRKKHLFHLFNHKRFNVSYTNKSQEITEMITVTLGTCASTLRNLSRFDSSRTMSFNSPALNSGGRSSCSQNISRHLWCSLLWGILKFKKRKVFEHLMHWVADTYQVLELVVTADHMLTDVMGWERLFTDFAQVKGLQRNTLTLPHIVPTWWPQSILTCCVFL